MAAKISPEEVASMDKILDDDTIYVDSKENTGASGSSPSTTPIILSLSNNERKRAIRKQLKDEKRKAHFQRLLLETGGITTTKDSAMADANRNKTTNRSGGGKDSRSRRARNGEVHVGSSKDHRPCGSGCAPVINGNSSSENASHEYNDVVRALDALETAARRKAKPDMLERKEVPTDNHGAMEYASSLARVNNSQQNHVDYGTGMCNFSECNLRSFSIPHISEAILSPPLRSPQRPDLSLITYLDLSRNEIWELPDGLSTLINLVTLDLSRNWFVEIPAVVGTLKNLSSLNANSNALTGTRESLKLDHLKTLSKLTCLDISMNKHCGRQDLADLIKTELPQIQTLHMTITFPRPAGTFVGRSPAERDATLLRSQLEPWSTSALRRRLVADFGTDLPDDDVPRHEVMRKLLQLYQEEQKLTGQIHPRTIVRAEGIPIDETLAKDLLVALRAWSDQAVGGNLERPSIYAKNYMILTAPSELAEIGGKNAYKSAWKLNSHKTIWELAYKAIISVDPVFAIKFTSLAVTHGFQGSPHIDRQNSAAFYGLSLGSFEEGTGGICVECSARIVACVNTRNRLAKVDGRNPHWVAPYDHQNKDRHSLIFYQTVGEREPIGPAIFQIPV